MYSQNNEETVILEHFKNQPSGRFLDIGAYDGKTFSNTLALAERGWSGVCVEPSISVIKALIDIHANRPSVKIVHAAIAAQASLLEFHDSNGDALSTFDAAHRAKWEAGYGSKFFSYVMPAISPADLFKQAGSDYDFINIDVEGINMEVFNSISDEVFKKCRCVCIEHDGRYALIEERLQPMGYVRLSINGENLIIGKL